MTEKSFQTKSIREGHEPTNEQEHSAAIFLTSSYKFNSAEEAAKRFDKKKRVTFILDLQIQQLMLFKTN